MPTLHVDVATDRPVATDRLGDVAQQAEHVAAGDSRRPAADRPGGRCITSNPSFTRQPSRLLARGDVIDELHAFGIVRPNRDDQRPAARTRAPRRRSATVGSPSRNTHRRRLPQMQVIRARDVVTTARSSSICQFLPHGLVVQPARNDRLAVWRRAARSRSTSRPAAASPARADRRSDRSTSSGSPTAVQLRCVRLTWLNENARGMNDTSSGIELPLDPVRPHPVEIVLNRLRVDDAAGVKQHAGAQQLDRLGHLRRLGKAANPRQPQRGIGEAVGPRGALNDELPWQESEHVAARHIPSIRGFQQLQPLAVRQRLLNAAKYRFLTDAAGARLLLLQLMGQFVARDMRF